MDRIEAHKLFSEILRKHDKSVTSARKSVFDAMLGREPQFMHEIVDRIGSAVDRASVYRTIELFEELGIAERLNIGWKYKLELSDLFSDHHHHLTCQNCGKTVAVEESRELERMIQRMARENGFVPEAHQLEVRGLCPACQVLPGG